MVKCIYCGFPVNPKKGEGDHVLPVQLGEFRNDKRFRRICIVCNNKIGQSEQQFLACGPESFFRRIVNPKIPKKRKRGSTYSKGAMGAPCPESTIDHGDHRQLVIRDENNLLNVYPIDQLVIHDDKDNEYFLKLYPGMKSKDLKDKITALGIKNIEKGWFHFDENKKEEFEALINSTFPELEKKQLPGTKAGITPTNGRVTFKVNDHYFRAITKIAFHYYLTHTRRGYRGDEVCFERIRNFIMNGGSHESFFNQPGPKFSMPFGDMPGGGVITPEQWCHILSAYEEENYIVVYLHLFVGRACIPRSFYVKLADIRGSIVIPHGVWGHVYMYDTEQQDERYAGSLNEAKLNRIR